MEHTQIITAADLEQYAHTRDSEAVIPELVWLLVNRSVPDLAECRIPYGDAINQPGWDGLVGTETGFRQFVPRGRSFWEIGTGGSPQVKATTDFKTRTRQMSSQERQNASYLFVTPSGAGAGGWDGPRQTRWISPRQKFGWKAIRILDAVQLADWLREFPTIGKWLLKRIGLVKTIAGFSIPTEHWQNLEQLSGGSDPPLPSKLFLIGRDEAAAALQRLFRGEINQLILSTESEHDAEDFVAAFLAAQDAAIQAVLSNKCVFVNDPETWVAMANLKTPHVLVAHPKLDLEFAGEQLHLLANRNGHGVIIPITGAWAGGNEQLIALRSPSAAVLERTLVENGFNHARASTLAGAGALSLAALKRHLRGLGQLPPYATWEHARELAQAMLAGRWSGENEADRAAMETIVGKSYGEWIEIVRPESLRPDTPLTQQDEKWKIISRGEAWSALGARVHNDDLDRLKHAAMTVLGERDPAFDLPLEERFGITRDAKRRMHSSSIRKGIAESLALLGSRSRALSSCSHGKAQTIAVLTVRELLENADWKAWASLNNHLPLLAEAAPDEFMDAVEAALINSATSPFRDLFAQERPGITGRTYTSGLLWALETLAWNPDHLVRVTMLLGELAEIDPGGKWSNRPGNSLVDIFLPWHPQTSATIEKRKSAVEALFLEHPAVGWNLIIALLPQSHSSTSGTRRPSWRDFIPAKWSEDVTRQDYWTQIQGYAEVAINAATTDSTKLAQLLDRLADLPSPAYERVLEHLSSDQVVAMPESDRLPLWETLVDLSAKHKKFADAQWALPSENVSAIENAASKVAPRSIDLIHRRLFSARDFDLFEEKGDFEEQQRRLDQRRESAVAEILNKKGIPGTIDFAGHVGSPEEVGGALGKLEFNGLDGALMPTYLQEDDQTLAAFIRGYVWSRFWTKSWAWVDGLINDTWTIEQRTKFLVLLPFFEETWRRAERYLGSQESEYWKNARVNPWGPQQNLPDAAKKLLSNARPQAALACLDRLVHQKTDFPPELALQALLETVATQNGPDRLDQYDMINVIKWLQENPKTDRAELFKVEWAYLPLLDRHLGAAPRTLESRLATDPKFFCDIIAMIFRSDKGEKKPDQETSDTDAKIAQNAYRLLNEWQTVPGQKPDGSFDQAAFVEWLKEVKRRTADSGHLRIALSQVGQVLPYAPTDPDGLWIRRAVADALNAKDASNMRSGFTCELFNMRGVHGYTSGADERAIAARYNDQANNAENAGYHRLATALRELAASYERDADREAHRDPFDDR